MVLFGQKNKKLPKFGHKIAKAGVFGMKTGGRLAALVGTMSGSPQLMASGAIAQLVSQGIEKLS